jgi:hypothetical protein
VESLLLLGRLKFVIDRKEKMTIKEWGLPSSLS